MRIYFFLTGLILLCASTVLSQSKLINGLVTLNGRPVIGLKVFTYFAETQTDQFGRYTLSKEGCQFCNPGDNIKIFTYKEGIGSSEQNYTVNKDNTFNFSVTRRPSNILIQGMVQNQVTGDPLPHMEVMVISSNVNHPDPVKTNAFGFFSMPVDMDLLENQNAIRLQVRDPLGNYRPVLPVPSLYQVNTFNVLQMEEKKVIKIQVSQFTVTRICINKGNIVTIEASGQITVGPFVGLVDPDGKANGIWGMSLQQYSIDPGITTSALMYRFKGDQQWRFAGKRKRFVAERDGCLEFEVNDADKSNNSGAFEVEVTVTGG
jgi:hypothetical protein